MDENNTILKQILAAQILIIANQIKAEKAAKGSWSTSDFTKEAAKIVKEKMPAILQLL